MHRAWITALLLAALPAAAHTSNCTAKAGVDKARCERHEAMYKQCGPLKGEEHFACDRTYLLAHPLQCGGLQGEEAAKCAKEVAAFKVCEPNAGVAFMKCVRTVTGESPMGH